MDGDRRSHTISAERVETSASSLQWIAGLAGVAALIAMVCGARAVARRCRPTLFDPKTNTLNYALLT